jgi:hypothetical protein
MAELCHPPNVHNGTSPRAGSESYPSHDASISSRIAYETSWPGSSGPITCTQHSFGFTAPFQCRQTCDFRAEHFRISFLHEARTASHHQTRSVASSKVLGTSSFHGYSVCLSDGCTIPRHEPNPILTAPWVSQHACITTSSPSSRNPRLSRVGSSSGSFPRRVNPNRHPCEFFFSRKWCRSQIDPRGEDCNHCLYGESAFAPASNTDHAVHNRPNARTAC